MRNIVIVSGGMDPIHKGHAQYIEAASSYGDVVVLLNSDAWLVRKKGYAFMCWDERKFLLERLRGVWRVDDVDDTDGSVKEGILNIHKEFKGDSYTILFAKGGDRILGNTPEVALCNELGIQIIWNCGGGKVQSSSELVNNVRAS
jgi:D-beta-D-heptose 7-phosphate kinase/D-beta-D-heptose 1-phosphate adenosyltransferase